MADPGPPARASPPSGHTIGAPLPQPSPATLALYAADWARFAGWCRAKGVRPLPASPDTLADFLLAVAPGLSRGSLGRLRAAVGATHRGAGLPVPRLTAAARRAIRGAAKPKRPPPPASFPPASFPPASFPPASFPPASSPAPLRAAAARCPRDAAGLRDRALFLLAAALPAGRKPAPDGGPGIARRALLLLDAEHVRLTPGGATLLLPTHPGEPSPSRSVTLLRDPDAATCPVRALEDWLRRSDTRYGPVFRKVDRWGSIEHARLHPGAWQRILARRAAAPPHSRHPGPAAP